MFDFRGTFWLLGVVFAASLAVRGYGYEPANQLPDRLPAALQSATKDSSVSQSTGALPDVPLQVPASSVIAIVNANVITMQSDEVLRGYTVIVKDGRIAELGPAAAVEVPSGAVRLNAGGWYVLPGLSDVHTHLATNYKELTGRLADPAELDEIAHGQLLLYLSNGVTTILNNGDFGEPVNRWKHQVREGRTPGPTIYTARYARGGRGTKDGGPREVTVTDDRQARQYVRESHELGYDFMKIYNGTPREAVLAVIDEGRKVGLATIGHFPQSMTAQEALSAGMAMVAHSGAYNWRIFHNRRDPQLLQDAIHMTRQADASVTATLGIERTIARVWGGNSENIAAYWRRPENRYMHWTERSLHERGITGPRWRPANSQPGGYDAIYEFEKQYTRALHEAGIKLLLGTDSPTVLGVAGFSIHEELAAMSELGLSAYEVLLTGTRHPGEFIARHVRGAEPFGTVQVGQRADLIVCFDNALDDLAHLRRRVGVVARGHWYSHAEMQRRLDALAERYSRQGPPTENEASSRP